MPQNNSTIPPTTSTHPLIVPREQAYVTDLALEDHGFPTEVSKAFLHTADETNCVVMSRAPGSAGTQLIREGYDLKGFLIKAKSCSWGPMAGFLCQIPALNKYGTQKIGYNYSYHKKYLEYRIRHQLLEQAAYVPLHISDERKRRVLGESSGTSNKKKNEYLLAKCFEPIGVDMVAGVAYPMSDKDPDIQQSVVMEFLLVRRAGTGGKPDLWSLYHGRIWYRAESTDKYSYLYDEQPDLDKDQVDRKRMPSVDMPKVRTEISEDGVLKTLQQQSERAGEYAAIAVPAKAAAVIEGLLVPLLGDVQRPVLANFYPICGAQNPYPPYCLREIGEHEDPDVYKAYAKRASEKLQTHCNAVTGDYDLFAIWPVKPKIDWPMMVRSAEKRLSMVSPAIWKTQPGTPQAAHRGISFFVDSAAKPCSLVLRASPNTFIEVIAGFAEIEDFESEELGNITELTAYVAQVLNSLVSLAAGRKSGAGASRVSPNMAFHSDEGGRPGIDDVDYPFAVYLPNSLFESIWRDHKRRYTKAQARLLNPRTRMLLIERHDDFVDLVCMLSDHCYVTMNHIWLMQMFTLLADRLDGSSMEIDVRGETTEKSKTDVTKKRKDYFEKRVTERDKAKKSNGSDPKILNLERLKAGLMHLFVGHLAAGTIGSNEKRENGEEALLQLAEAFLQIAAKDFESDLGTVERMIGRLNAAMIVPASAAAASK